MEENETYIGDGIYASITQSRMIKLRCASPSEPNVMYLEPEVLAEFYRFVAKANRNQE